MKRVNKKKPCYLVWLQNSFLNYRKHHKVSMRKTLKPLGWHQYLHSTSICFLWQTQGSDGNVLPPVPVHMPAHRGAAGLCSQPQQSQLHWVSHQWHRATYLQLPCSAGVKGQHMTSYQRGHQLSPGTYLHCTPWQILPPVLFHGHIALGNAPLWAGRNGDPFK